MSEHDKDDNQPDNETAPNNGPVRTLRDGPLSSSVFMNKSEDKQFPTATISRNWQDQDGNWHSSNSFSESQLKRVSDLALNTRDVMVGLRHDQALVNEVQEQATAQPDNREAEPDQTSSLDTERQNYIASRQAQTEPAPEQEKTQPREAPREH
ncbi:MAG: hypothetical protein AAFW83_09055 [Pseudomonadota bacterium]